MLSVEEKAELLGRTDLFGPLSKPELALVAEKAYEQVFSRGSVIFREKEVGGSLYVITQGSVLITRGDVFIHKIGENTVFGEMALLDGGERSATATAATDVTALTIEQGEFLRATEKNWNITRRIFKTLGEFIRRQSDLYIEKVFQQEETARKMRYSMEINKYMEIGKALSASLNVSDILATLLNRINQIIQARGALVLEIDPLKSALFMRDFKGFDDAPPTMAPIPLEPSTGPTLFVEGKPLVVPDIERLEAPDTIPAGLLRLIRKSALFVPLKTREEVVGFLGAVDVEDVELYLEERGPFLEILTDYISVALANATNFETIERLSITDDVSGFYNTRFLHSYLNEILSSARSEKEKVSLVFFDLDNFKRTVDAHGHLLGSKALKEVAEFVRAYLDEEDKIVRYGGDEYILILPYQDRAIALSKVEKIKEGFATARFLMDENISEKLSASFGVATFPEDAADKASLLRAADRYMYESKYRGKNRISTKTE